MTKHAQVQTPKNRRKQFAEWLSSLRHNIGRTHTHAHTHAVTPQNIMVLIQSHFLLRLMRGCAVCFCRHGTFSGAIQLFLLSCRYFWSCCFCSCWDDDIFGGHEVKALCLGLLCVTGFDYVSGSGWWHEWHERTRHTWRWSEIPGAASASRQRWHPAASVRAAVAGLAAAKGFRAVGSNLILPKCVESHFSTAYAKEVWTSHRHDDCYVRKEPT